MHRSRLVAAAIGALALVLLTSTPATAASSPAVRAKALHQPSVYESYYTSVRFEYQCPTGAVATVSASISQPGTGAFYDSTAPFEPKPVLTCDGEKHAAHIGLISPGYTEENAATYDAPYLQDTAQGFGRGTVVVTVTAAGRSATDSTRVTVQSRDV